ncbi:MAG TPA: hypothetical protein DC047_15980 [Blastocatellia bacterium]|nr:hypothetical protein [Blastocatellia bacterium]
MWLLANGLFFLNLAGSTYVALFKKWVSFSPYRLIIGEMFFALLPVTIWLIEPLPALLQLFLLRVAQALVLSLMLLVITQKWYWGVAILMLLVSLATSVIAGVPYAFVKSISLEWFEVSKFFVNSLLLAVLFGCWLVKSTSHDY